MVLHTPSLLSLASYRLNTMHLWIHVYVFSFSHSQLLYLLSILHSTMISSASLCLHSHKTPVLQFLTKDPFCYSHLYGVMFLTHSHTTILAGSSQLANGPHWKMFKDCCSRICIYAHRMQIKCNIENGTRKCSINFTCETLFFMAAFEVFHNGALLALANLLHVQLSPCTCICSIIVTTLFRRCALSWICYKI